MSNWSVAHRAQTLDDIVGNETIVKTLKGYINSKNVPQAILFSGITGTGKTTMARIFAQMIQQQKVDIKPAADLSNIPGVIEKNMGDERKIDDVRDLIAQTQVYSLNSKYKVIICDEVHLMPRTSASALLKPIEDSPDHVFWILCTDQPGALLATIRNRCQHITLDPPTADDLYKMLRNISKKEKVVISKKAERNDMILKKLCRAIANNTVGQPRDSIQVLQQCVSYMQGCGEKITADNVSEIIKKSTKRLQVVNPAMLPTDLLDYIYNEKLEELAKRLSEAEDLGQTLTYMIYNNHMWLQECCGVKQSYNYFFEQLKKRLGTKNLTKACVVSSSLNEIHSKVLAQYSSNALPLITAELVKLVLRLKQQTQQSRG